MKRKRSLSILLIFALILSCRKEQPNGQAPGSEARQTLSLDSVRQWYALQADSAASQALDASASPLKNKPGTVQKHFDLAGLPLNWSKAESMPNQRQNYWLMALDGQPTDQKVKQGYRKIAFLKDLQGHIQACILEIIPDALTYQREQTIRTHDFTGKVFVYDQNYQLTGGTLFAGGKAIGRISPKRLAAAANTTKTPATTTQLPSFTLAFSQQCEWIDDNYIDANEGVVIYSYQVCTYIAEDNTGFSGGTGDYLGKGGGGGGTASSAPAVSNLPGETGPKIDPKKYMDCFGTIPDQGATMKVTVYVQEPWPGTSFNVGPNSVGHTAIGLTKTNGSASITQVVGFYPDASGFAKIHAPSKLVVNNLLEYNLSITYSVDATHFNQILNYISNPPPTYDLSNFNCTSFVYTACQSGGITLPDPYSIVGLSGVGTIAESMTPAGLGASIDKMKGQSNVNTSGGTTPNSKGPCN